MLKFKDVSEEQRGEVVRIASEMFDRETAEKRERDSTVAAAEELGIPEEYLERAAQVLQEKRIAEARQKRTNRKRFLIGGSIAAALGVGAFVLRPTPPVTPMVLSPAAVQPLLSANTGTNATTAVEGNTFVLKVDRFAPVDNRYSANLDLPLPKTSLSGYRQLTFTIKGTIPKIRLFLEGGSLNERWKGPDVAVSETTRKMTVPLSEFTEQQRSSNNTWKDIGRRRPDMATTLSIKSGAPFNPSNVSGTIGISEIEFK